MSKNKKKRAIEVEEKYYALSPETKKGLAIIILFAVSLISILSFLNLAGRAGIMIDFALGLVLGWARFLFPIILLVLSYVLLRPARYQTNWANYVGLVLFFFGLNGLLQLQQVNVTSWSESLNGLGGGLLGFAVDYPLLQYLGFWGSLIILIALVIGSILLMFNTGLERLLHRLNIFNYKSQFLNPFQRSQSVEKLSEAPTINEPLNEEVVVDDKETTGEEIKTKKGLFSLPAEANESTTEKFAHSKFKTIRIDLPINLLSDKSVKPRSGDTQLSMERIESTLHNFGIEIEMGDVSVGPTVTQYTFKPADGVKLTRITTLSNDLALALAAHPIRIEAPIPGKSLVGIEVPNFQPAVVPLRAIIDSEGFKTRRTNLTLGLGKDVSGQAWVSDLTKMPHLLVAGATGSGKSVCLNTVIISLLYQNNPDMLRFILVDPKRVEFTVYNGIPHLLTPVITDVTKTINALRWAIQEMDQRFDILSKAGKRNIASYNELAQNKMPYIVIVIDELADLMVVAPAEVEACIIRLTQMARAVGIHLVVATQRPSVDIITGLIKANIPARIAFSVASSIDSRTILDSTGAEKLVGKGDMLFQTAELSKPRRLQGAFVSDDEIKRVVNFLKQVAGEPEYDESVTEKQKGKTSFDFGGKDADDDDLLSEARQLVIQSGKASASYLQRRLRVGYARAARLLDLLEDQGVIGPGDGAKPRDVLITADQLEDSEATPTVFKEEPAEVDSEESEAIEEAEELEAEEADEEDKVVLVDEAGNETEAKEE